MYWLKPSTLKGYVEVAEARSQVYGLLSALYLELPNLKVLHSVFDAEFERQFTSAASRFEAGEMKDGLKLIASFVTAFRDKPRTEALKRISIDRTRLFQGVNPEHSPPPPYESVYRDGRLWGKSTVEVSQIYGRLGVKLPEAWTEPPDHIGIELDFMRLICLSEMEAWQAGYTDKALEYLEAGTDFLRKHVVQWVPVFCEEMYNRAGLDFYRGIAQLTRGFVEYDSRLADRQVSEARKQLAVEP